MAFSSTVKPGQEKSVATSTTCWAEVLEDINSEAAMVAADKVAQLDFMCIQAWITKVVPNQGF